MQCNAADYQCVTSIIILLLQKAAFYRLKGGLLRCNMWSFAFQKATYWKYIYNQPFFQRQQQALQPVKNDMVKPKPASLFCLLFCFILSVFPSVI